MRTKLTWPTHRCIFKLNPCIATRIEAYYVLLDKICQRISGRRQVRIATHDDVTEDRQKGTQTVRNKGRAIRINLRKSPFEA